MFVNKSMLNILPNEPAHNSLVGSRVKFYRMTKRLAITACLYLKFSSIVQENSRQPRSNRYQKKIPFGDKQKIRKMNLPKTAKKKLHKTLGHGLGSLINIFLKDVSVDLKVFVYM